VAERKKLQFHITPAGIAQYPRLTKPDTKFNPDGHYKVTLVLPGAEAQPLIELIDKAMGESLILARRENPTKAKTIKAATDKPYKAVTADDGNENGDYKFNFKMAASGRNKTTGETWSRKPVLFDAKLKPLINPKVGGGSTIKVKFEMFLFYTPLVGAGVSLRLLAVQILDLVEYGGASADGFAAEDGYESDADEQAAAERAEFDRLNAKEAAERKAEATSQQEDDEVPF
jgi:hypothetical protein